MKEVWHYQNALLACGALQRTRGAGSRKETRVFFAKVASVALSPVVSQSMKMALWIFKNIFWEAIVCITLVGTPSADMHYIFR
jgi:hypothetical protein